MLALGLGARIIRARSQDGTGATVDETTDPPQHNEVIQSNEVAVSEGIAARDDAGSIPSQNAAPPAKRRGRPPKAKAKTTVPNVQSQSPLGPPRSRGRPRAFRKANTPAETFPSRSTRSRFGASTELQQDTAKGIPHIAQETQIHLSNTARSEPTSGVNHDAEEGSLQPPGAAGVGPNSMTGEKTLPLASAPTETTNPAHVQTIGLTSDAPKISPNHPSPESHQASQEYEDVDLIQVQERGDLDSSHQQHQDGDLPSSDEASPQAQFQTAPQTPENGVEDPILPNPEVAAYDEEVLQPPQDVSLNTEKQTSIGIPPTVALENRNQDATQTTVAEDVDTSTTDVTTSVQPSTPRGRKRKASEVAPTSSALGSRSRTTRKIFKPLEATPTKASSKTAKQALETSFMSHDEMEYEDGVPRVYIDYPGTEKPREVRRGRKELSMIALFKSGKLKDPQFLENGAGSWVEAVAERMAAHEIRKSDGLFPKKRKKTDTGDKASDPNAEPAAQKKRAPRPRKSAKSEVASAVPASSFQGLREQSDLDQETSASQGQEYAQSSPYISHHASFSSDAPPTTHRAPIQGGFSQAVPFPQPSIVSSAQTSSLFNPKNATNPNIHDTEINSSDNPQNAARVNSERQLHAGLQTPAGSHSLPPPDLYVNHAPPPSGPSTWIPGRNFDPILQRQETEARVQAYRSPFVVSREDTEARVQAYRSPFEALREDTEARVQSYRSPFASASPYAQSDMHAPAHSPQMHASFLPSMPSQQSTPHAPLRSQHQPAPVQNRHFFHHPSTAPGYANHIQSPLAHSSNSPISTPLAQHFLQDMELTTNELSFVHTPDRNGQPRQPAQRAQSFPHSNIPPPEIEPPGPLAGQSSQGASTQSPIPPNRKRKAYQASDPNVYGISNTQANTQMRRRSSGLPDTFQSAASVDYPRGELATLEMAEAVEIPNAVARLVAFYNGQAGNLLLSDDKSTLEFIGLNQHPPEVAALVLRISDLQHNPTTSAQGSKTMELRIKASQGDGLITHHFKVASTPAAYEAMNDMRAKVVTAIIADRFRRVEKQEAATEEMKKPFKCEKCNKRFRNSNGLDYHLKKSNSECNPNWDASMPKYVRTKPRTPTKQKAPKGSTKASPVEQELDYESDSSVSSEDSIIEWAQRNATDGFQRGQNIAPKTPRKTKVYRSFPAEKDVLQEIAKDLSANKPMLQSNCNNGVSEGLTVERCEEILLNLPRLNNGIFPGDRSIWFAFVAVWLKENADSEVLPESKLCSKTLDGLIDAGRLKMITFLFRDGGSRNCERSIVTVPEFDATSPTMDMMKELIKVSHPGYYVPSRFEPPEPILSKLKALANRNIARLQRDSDEDDEPDSESQREQSLESHFDYESSEDEFTLEGDVSMQSESDLEGDGAYESDEDSVTGVPTAIAAMIKRDVKRTAKKSASTNPRWQKQSQLLREKWAAAKACGANVIGHSSPLPNGTWYKKSKDQPRTREERNQLAIYRRQLWDIAPTFLPNPATGAWDSVPVKKIFRPYYRKLRIPEPITFMQAPDGSWSQRPFGHGVNPIFARPARRADGNPGLEDYLKKIENGHRPVIMPQKNRLFLPALPSKRLLQGGRQPKSRHKRPGRPKKAPDTPDSAESEGQATSRDLRRASTLSLVESISEFDDFMTPKPEVRKTRQPRNSSKAAQPDLDEVEILNFLEPKKLVQGGPQNPGLDSLPPVFSLNSSQTNIATDHDVDKYGAIQFVDAVPIEYQSGMADNSWTVVSMELANTENPSIKWDDRTSFTLETLPYEQLCTFLEEIDAPIDTTVEVPPAKRQKRNCDRKTPKNKFFDKSQKFATVRPLSALPADFDGVFDVAKDAEIEFGVQVAEPSEFTQNRKRYKGESMSPEVESRFVIAVVVVRTLTGGLEQQVDWVLLSTLFTSFSLHYLTKLWHTIQSKKAAAIDRLVLEFQKAFLPAYQSSEIPPLDYDHLVDYNWNALVDWAISNVQINLTAESILLPDSRKELKKMYSCTEHDREDNDVQTTYFGLFTPVYKRTEAVASIPKTIPSLSTARPSTSNANEIDDYTVAKSWVRATAFTEDKDWDAKAAASILIRLDDSLVKEIKNDLIDSKVIVDRPRGVENNGRRYLQCDSIGQPLRKQVQPETYIQAAAFKELLDEEFKAGNPCVRVDYMADDGSLMCITSLVAGERVRLQPVDVPMNKWGLADEDSPYETKKIPKSRLRFEMDIYPTSTYLFDDENELLDGIGYMEPPRETQKGAIPVWYGITGRLVGALFKNILVAVGGTVALRAGITNEGIRKVFNPLMEDWEVGLLMAWGEEMGIFKRLDGVIEGWTVGEWWWIIMGKFYES